MCALPQSQAMKRQGAESNRSAPADRAGEEAPIEQVEAEELKHISPEGRPADPAVRSRTLAVLIAVAIGVVITAAALIAGAGSPGFAIAIGLVGVIVVLLANPVIWASALRAREREQLHHEHEEKGDVQP